jgi:hypothetical protein
MAIVVSELVPDGIVITRGDSIRRRRLEPGARDFAE